VVKKEKFFLDCFDVHTEQRWEVKHSFISLFIQLQSNFFLWTPFYFSAVCISLSPNMSLIPSQIILLDNGIYAAFRLTSVPHISSAILMDHSYTRISTITRDSFPSRIVIATRYPVSSAGTFWTGNLDGRVWSLFEIALPYIKQSFYVFNILRILHVFLSGLVLLHMSFE
jgi:hypothetical protein